MSSRAAFLPSGDPMVLNHALHYYKNVWHEEVDKLYVLFNSKFDDEIINWVKEMVEDCPNTVFIYAPELMAGGASMPHGLSLTRMLEKCREDYIVFVEDDSIIFKKGLIDKYFKMIESGEYKMIGSPRMSCSVKWADLAKEKFNLNYEGLGDKGPNFWPCFFFCRREDLLKTDRQFIPRFFKPGEYIKPLDYTVTEEDGDQGGDTFVWGSIQMRDITDNSVLEIPQYHAFPNWEDIKLSNMGIWDGNCGWIHFGSLSSGLENVLMDSNNIPLRNKYCNNPIKGEYPKLNSEMEKREYEHRVLWWTCALDKAGLPLGKNKSFIDRGLVYKFASDYLDALRRLKVALNLDKDRIEKTKLAYLEVIGDLMQ